MNANKKCSKCRVQQAISEFYPRKTRKSGVSSWCKSCYKMRRKSDTVKEYQRKYYQIHKEELKFVSKNNHQKQIGSSIQYKEELLQSQGNRCAICKINFPGARGWHTDHIHDTKIVRGVLCHNCNVGLGHFKDSEKLLNAAITYLSRFTHPQVSIEKGN